LESTPYYKTYANLSTAIACGSADPKGQSRPASHIYSSTTGTAVVRPMGGSVLGTNDVTLNLVAGMPPLPAEFGAVISGTATNVTLFWPR